MIILWLFYLSSLHFAYLLLLYLLISSFDGGELSIHRKLPKSESLKDCMDRTIPYYQEQIAPKAINDGKRILISSSENAIRGLLMTLCDIPEDKIAELEIPNGLPMIYDLKSRCIKLLDDGTGEDPLKKYNFGNAASYLFRPCINEDGEEMVSRNIFIIIF